MRRVLIGLVLLLLLVARPQGQTAPKIAWTHSGTNVTRFEIALNNDWVIQAGLPTPTANVYEYTLPALPAGTWTAVVKACYGTDCVAASSLTIVKMVAAGAKNHNFYWVSPTGASTWANCKSDTPLSGTDACPLSLASTSALAGDTVWLRGGSGGGYTIDTNYGNMIIPSASGSAGSPITFAAYPGEVPLLQQANTSNKANGLYIDGKDYIVVRGITFHNFQRHNATLAGDADYNEIAYCSFTRDAAFVEATTWPIVIGYNGAAPWANHNWFHHNYVVGARFGPCDEGMDGIRIGLAIVSPYSGDNNNTVEHNYFEYSAHANLVTYSKYNTIRNNIFHNEPWITGCTVYDGSMPSYIGLTNGTTSTTSMSLENTGDRTFAVSPGLTTYWVAGNPLTIVRRSDWTKAMWGVLKSYNIVTGSLVVTVSKRSTTGGPYTDWYVAMTNFPQYTNAAYAGKYSHRNIVIGDSGEAAPYYTLAEGNRLGFGGTNPNNGGADNLDISTPSNIVRYNAAYGAMASGIFMKGAYAAGGSGAINNRVYNNTSYANGLGWDSTIYGGLNLGYHGQGIGQYSIGGGVTANVIKNNVVYGNGSGDICEAQIIAPASCVPNTTIDTVTNNLTGTDPLFVAPTMTDPTSQHLIPTAHGYTATPIPDLRLGTGSDAIDGGGALTTVHADDTGSGTTLKVTDALYFQDASWGSSLANGKTAFADWIAIGTVSNVAQIASINYATNTITLVSDVSRSDGDSVWLVKKSDGVTVLVGAAPDQGAYESGTSATAAPTSVVIR